MQRLNVTFAGRDTDPLSCMVLDALAGADSVEVTVVVSRPLRRGLVNAWRRTWRAHGFHAVWRGGRKLIGLELSRLVGRRDAKASHRSLTDIIAARRLDEIRSRSINDPATVAAISSRNPDLLVIAGFDQILRPAVRGLPRLEVVNVHPSLLPAYRGPNPVYWVLHNREAKTGVSIHLVDEGIDTGDLLAQQTVDIDTEDTEETLQRRLASKAAEMIVPVLLNLASGDIKPAPQPTEGGSYFPHPPRGASKL